jgi:metal-responsive CopG/Arc/MetJ family transcriptional regulator
VSDNNTISISLPCEYIRLIDSASKDDDLSRAQLIRRIIKEYIAAKDYERKYPDLIVLVQEKPKQTATIEHVGQNECHCKTCGVYVHMKPEQFKNNGNLCLNCKRAAFEN